MDTIDSSRPTRRHYRHHHQRHSHHRGHGYTKEVHANDPNDEPRSKRRRRSHHEEKLDTGNLNQPQSQRFTNDLVENWLERTGVPGNNAWSTCTGSAAKITLPNPSSSRRKGAKAVSGGRVRRTGSTWELRESWLRDRRPSPLFSPSRYRKKQHARKDHLSDDSSLLSGFENGRAALGSSSLLQAHGYNDRGITPREKHRKVDANIMDLPSQRSSFLGSPCFEKRPRYKTREDKYDVHKKNKHEHEVEDEGRQRKSRKRGKREKRKALVSSKKVMSNFNSKAVLNDRITVKPNLKPGIFKNGREAGVKPIPDLVFSDMHFLQDRRHESNPKTHSKNERQLKKRNAEIEEVSSFFLPPKQVANYEEPRKTTRRIKEDPGPRWLRAQYHENISPAPGRNVIITSPSEQRISRTQPKSLLSYDQTSQTSSTHPPDGPQTQQDVSKESKAATYYTWSSSQPRSPILQPTSPSLRKEDSWPSVTPESIRRALIRTGVYRGAGLHAYDDQMNVPSTNKRMRDTPTIYSKSDLYRSDMGNEEGPESPESEVQHRDDVTTTEDQEISMLDRWKQILPPEWRAEHSSSIRDSGGVCAIRYSPTVQVSDSSQQWHFRSKGPQSSTISRQAIANIARLGSRSKKRTPSRSGNKSNVSAELHHHQTVGDLETFLGSNPSDPSEITSHASRDAMPPPPPLPVDRLAPCKFNEPTQHGTAQKRRADVAIQVEGASAGELITTVNGHQVHIKDVSHAGRNASVGSQGPTEGTDNTLSSLQSVSWISQIQIPPTPVIARSATAPGLRTRTPFFVDQLTEIPRSTSNSMPSGAANKRSEETMADFIARIEREVTATGPESLADDSAISDELLNAQETVDEHHFEHGRLPNLHSKMSQGSFEPYYSGPISSENLLPYHPEQRDEPLTDDVGYQLNTCAPMTTHQTNEGVENIEDEKWEMSNFWGPNRFSQF